MFFHQMLQKLLLICLTFVSFISADADDHWAVIVAGSKDYENYRHHADIYHAWHIMRSNGIPEDNIILFAYDNIAFDPNNPFPGQIFNRPSPGSPGVDVKHNVTIDYLGNDVTLSALNLTLRGQWES